MAHLMGNRKKDYVAKDEYHTPKLLFDQLKVIFDLDVAAPVGGATNVPAVEYFDQNSDGLTAKWFGNVWMNPPFSQATPWVTKFINHRLGIALLPTSKAAWFSEIWNDAEGIVLLNRVKFDYLGKEPRQIFMPCMLFAYGSQNVRALKNLTDSRVR